MPGVFVSHASADKDVVEKVVFFLLSRGVPVWYDSIELSLGNRLIQSIRKGVDRSTCFLVLLSRNALSSAWVAQEIELALQHERELGRDFLLVGLLDDLEVPEAVADRVYVRLVGDEFLAGCDRIRDHLLSQNVGMRDIPLRQQIVPVAFRRGVHLEKFELARKLEAIRSAFGPDALAGLGTGNFRCFLEFKLRDLEKRAQAAALSQDDDPDLPDEESHAAKLILERVAGEKRSILDGIRLIAQNWPADSAAEASYWFAKNLRHGIICALSRKAFAKPDDEPEIETVFGRMPSDERAQWLFNVARPFQVRIVDAQSHERLFRAWLDADSLGCRDLLDEKWIARALHNNKLAHAAVTKFLLPAMLWHHYRGLCDELRWDFRNCIVERVI